jgi:hypothetical protein
MTMRAKCLVCLLAAAGPALLLAACAPVGPPEPEPNGAGPAAVEGAGPAKGGVPKGEGKDLVRRRVELAIKNVRARDLLTTHGFWTVFHGILGLGPRHALLTDPATGKKVNAVDYICAGNPVRGMEFIPTDYGLDVRTAVGELVFLAQGHQDQFIAEMTQWGMPLDRPFIVQGKTYHFRDFVNHCRMRASLKPDADGKKSELSWTVLVIGQYDGPDAEWTNKDGERLRLKDLLRYELGEPMRTAACGGTHRLFDLSWVYHLHLKRGGKVEGVWKEVADNAARYQALARKYQHPDGSFSTDFFNGPGDVPDPQRRLNTSGHILEWLSLALTDAQLRQPWVEEAANRVAMMILEANEMEGATLYHAVHGLIIYHARAFDRAELGRDLPMLPLPPAGPAAHASRR